MLNLADPSICHWEPAPHLIASGNIWGNFIYYSHLFPSLSILLIAIFVFINNPKAKTSLALLLLALSFTAWSLIDLVLWASERSDLIMFFWSILIHFDLLIYVSAFYFVYTLLRGAWPTWKYEVVILTLFIPLVLFAHTPLNLAGFDFTNCWREALEGPLWQQYVYVAEVLITGLILAFSVKEIRTRRHSGRRLELSLAVAGIVAFLLSFSAGNIFGSLEVDWELGQYGLFGMPIFVVFITYLMIRYQTFKAKVLATEALVVGLGILITSLLFVRKLENVQVIALSTLAITIILGVLLIKSVRKEVQQREEIEKLASKLEKANVRLKELDKAKSEFVSIASHQLRSPLTSIRGYASMLLEDSFGTIPNRAKEPLERIGTSARRMALAVEDYLNISRIESGNMTYEKADFNLRDEIERICDDVRPAALKQGLVLLFRSDLQSKAIVNADIGKTTQIAHNLINNSLKYTQKGSVTVLVRDNVKTKKIFVEVTDTGIGMSQETIHKLFQKFSRADNANEINSVGTGLGLFIAGKMAEGMGGVIEASSEGESKGSKFVLTLPLAM